MFEYHVSTRYNGLGWQRTTSYKEGVWVNAMGETCWASPRKQREMKEVFGFCLTLVSVCFLFYTTPHDALVVLVSCN
jgi:hypothetical protein